MIKIIMEHYATRFDQNGNRYHKTKITNTQTGNSLTFSTPHPSNSEALLFNALDGLNWREVYTVNSFDMKRYHFNRIEADMHNTCMDEAVVKAIRAL